MSLNSSTALALRACVSIGLSAMVVGLAMSLLGMGTDVLYAGTLVLIASPFVGVVVTFLSLARSKDWFWAAIAASLIVITAAGACIAML